MADLQIVENWLESGDIRWHVNSRVEWHIAMFVPRSTAGSAAVCTDCVSPSSRQSQEQDTDLSQKQGGERSQRWTGLLRVLSWTASGSWLKLRALWPWFSFFLTQNPINKLWFHSFKINISEEEMPRKHCQNLCTVAYANNRGFPCV